MYVITYIHTTYMLHIYTYTYYTHTLVPVLEYCMLARPTRSCTGRMTTCPCRMEARSQSSPVPLLLNGRVTRTIRAALNTTHVSGLFFFWGNSHVATNELYSTPNGFCGVRFSATGDKAKKPKIMQKA